MLELCDFISSENVRHPLEARDPRAAIEELVSLLHQQGRIQDPDTICQIVWEREQQRSTGIGEGIAVPHGRCEHLDEIAAAVGYAPEPIDFGSGDGKPVHLVFLLVSPTENTSIHVQALGAISRHLGQDPTRRAVSKVEDAEELFALLTAPVAG